MVGGVDILILLFLDEIIDIQKFFNDGISFSTVPRTHRNPHQNNRLSSFL